MEAAEIYADTRNRLADLIGGLTDHQLARPVPACPGSTVKDLAGHLAAVSGTEVEDRMRGTGRDAYPLVVDGDAASYAVLFASTGPSEIDLIE